MGLEGYFYGIGTEMKQVIVTKPFCCSKANVTLTRKTFILFTAQWQKTPFLVYFCRMGVEIFFNWISTANTMKYLEKNRAKEK